MVEKSDDQKLKQLLILAKNNRSAFEQFLDSNFYYFCHLSLEYCACSRCNCGLCRCPYVINHPPVKILLPDFLNKTKANEKSEFNNLPLSQSAYAYNYPKESIDEKSLKQEDYKKQLEKVPYVAHHSQQIQQDYGPFNGNSNYKQNFVSYNSNPIPNQKFPERCHQVKVPYTPKSTYNHYFQQIPVQVNQINNASYLNYKMPAFGNNLPFLNQKNAYREPIFERDPKYLPINELYTNNQLTPYPGTFETLQQKNFKGLSDKFCPAKGKILDTVVRHQLLEEIYKQAELFNL